MLELYGNYRKVTEHRPELDGMEWKLLEATCIVQVMGLVGPYSYPYHHAQPCDLWCRRQSDVKTSVKRVFRQVSVDFYRVR